MIMYYDLYLTVTKPQVAAEINLVQNDSSYKTTFFYYLGTGYTIFKNWAIFLVKSLKNLTI